MTLTVAEGTETVFLAIILLAAEEDKSVSQFLSQFGHKEKIPSVLPQIQSFARSKLSHPVLNIATQMMKELLSSYLEKGRKQEPK